eukprot:PhM_4_TR3042/c1_g2_i2/m.45468
MTSTTAVLFTALCLIVVTYATADVPFYCPLIQCPDIKKLPNDPSIHTDPSLCLNGDCPTCLSADDPEWSSRLQALGVGTRKRTTRPLLSYADWLSIEATSTIFHLLARDLLGYDLYTTNVDVSSYHVVCCPDTPIMRMESWSQSVLKKSDDNIILVDQLNIGYAGYSALFVAKSTVQRYPLATAYNAYKYLPEYSHILPRAFSTPCEALMVNASLGCVTENLHCGPKPWAGELDCVEGRYVPPQCAGSLSQYCQEVYHVRPEWDSGWFEALVNNTGLNFTIAYLGSYNLAVTTLTQLAMGNDVMFYWFSPDPLVSRVGAVAVNFKTYTPECELGRSPILADSTLDCAYPTTMIKKIATKWLVKQEEDLAVLFRGFTFTDTGINTLLAQHTLGGGASNTYNISCDWIKNNYATWSPWIQNSPEPTAPPTPETSGDSSTYIIVIVVIAVVAIATVVCVFVVRGKAVNRYAPRKAPLALMFTDIESSTKLWQKYGDRMAV